MRIRPRDDSGATAVEFALVLPIFVVLVFGIISFGFLYTNWTALEGGAREGARYMAIHSYSDPAAATEAANRARAAATLPCTAPGPCTAVPDPPRCTAAASDITYRMSAPVELNIPFVTSQTFNLTAEAVMRCSG